MFVCCIVEVFYLLWSVLPRTCSFGNVYTFPRACKQPAMCSCFLCSNLMWHMKSTIIGMYLSLDTAVMYLHTQSLMCQGFLSCTRNIISQGSTSSCVYITSLAIQPKSTDIVNALETFCNNDTWSVEVNKTFTSSSTLWLTQQVGWCVN